MDRHSQHFHERQSDLLRRFAAIQARLLSGYEATATQARAQLGDADTHVAGFARVRLAWAERASAELRERMARDE